MSATDRTVPCVKLRFRDRDRALLELAHCIGKYERGDLKRGECRAYYCDPCDSWHLTARPSAAMIREGWNR